MTRLFVCTSKAMSVKVNMNAVCVMQHEEGREGGREGDNSLCVFRQRQINCILCVHAWSRMALCL